MRKRSLILILAVAFLGTACGTTQVAPASPTPSSPSPSASPTVSAQPIPSPTAPDEATPPTPVSEEELQEALKTARFSTREWGRTDFRLHSVPLREFTGGGPGKDDIPAIDNPGFETVEEADTWLDEREPVQVVEINGDARAYPQRVLIWHEIVNDLVGGEPVAVTY